MFSGLSPLYMLILNLYHVALGDQQTVLDPVIWFKSLVNYFFIYPHKQFQAHGGDLPDHSTCESESRHRFQRVE